MNEKLAIKSELDDINIIISNCSEKSCVEYNSKLVDSLNKVDMSEKPIHYLIRDVTGYTIEEDAKGNVFPMECFFGNRFRHPTDLNKEQLDILYEALPTLQDPELKARICDVLCTLKYGNKIHEIAKDAIKYYLLSAKTLMDTSTYLWKSRFIRALRLFMGFGFDKANNITSDIDAINIIQNIILENKQRSSNVLATGELILIFYSHTKIDMSTHTSFLTEEALSREKMQDFKYSRELWSIAKIICKDKIKADDFKQKFANTYYQDALLQESNGASPMIIGCLLEESIRAYRQTSNLTIIVKTIYPKLREVQPRIRDELQSYSFDIDISKEILEVQKHFSGKDKAEALILFSRTAVPLSKKYVSELEISSGSVLSQTVTTTYYDEKFKNIDRPNNADTDTIKYYRFLKEFGIRKMILKTKIEPALSTIKNEHVITLNDWIDLIQHSSLIDPDRLELFAKALNYGFSGDFVTFAHLIIPQLEHTFRLLLKTLQLEPTKMLDNMTQEDRGFSWALIECQNELGTLIGNDEVFDLRGLLIEKSGSNLRHNMLHGLSSSAAMEDDSAYLFWLTIHIILKPCFIHQN